MERGFATRIFLSREESSTMPDRKPRVANPHSIVNPHSTRMPYLDPEKPIRKQCEDLPHWQQGDVWTFLTFRLGDALPNSKLLRWKEEKEAWLGHFPKPWDKETENRYHRRFGKMMDDWLDAGHGSCLLQKKPNSEVVSSAFHHFNHERYELSDFVVMPNHIHALFRPLPPHRLGDIVKTWKTFAAKEINRLENRSGPLWQGNYWDRLIRSAEHFKQTQNYIRNNPKNLRAGSYVLWSAGL